ncbi:hypothetical protein BD770DRAFT_401292 [Pilaira anomala]|nr:hypothetical protein BD770DRAFT_401292 [Pilaira anomala]
MEKSHKTKYPIYFYCSFSFLFPSSPFFIFSCIFSIFSFLSLSLSSLTSFLFSNLCVCKFFFLIIFLVYFCFYFFFYIF